MQEKSAKKYYRLHIVSQMFDRSDKRNAFKSFFLSLFFYKGHHQVKSRGIKKTTGSDKWNVYNRTFFLGSIKNRY